MKRNEFKHSQLGFWSPTLNWKTGIVMKLRQRLNPILSQNCTFSVTYSLPFVHLTFLLTGFSPALLDLLYSLLNKVIILPKISSYLLLPSLPLSFAKLLCSTFMMLNRRDDFKDLLFNKIWQCYHLLSFKAKALFPSFFYSASWRVSLLGDLWTEVCL